MHFDHNFLKMFAQNKNVMLTTFVEFNDQAVIIRTAKIPIRNGSNSN